MDVLKPKYISVGNRCYRSFDGQQDSRSNETSPLVEEKPEVMKKFDSAKKSEESKRVLASKEPEDESDVEIIELKDSRLLVKVDVPKCFRGLVCGTKYQTLNRITSATNTKMEFPFENNDGPMKIFGNSRAEILTARKRVNDIVDSARKRTDFTHFVAVYVRESAIKKNFNQFRNEVMSKYGGSNGIDNKVFQDEQRLHLTLGILVLLGDNERKKADSLLFNVVQNFVQQTEIKEEIKIRFKGVDYMNDDPSEVHVLYAKVEQISGSIDFQRLSNEIVKEFAKSKLMINVSKEDVKLHLTLMNSKFRNKEKITDTNYNPKRVRDPFNATQILEDYKDYFFGEMVVNEIELLRNGFFDERGFYKSTAKVPLKKASSKPKTAVRMVLEDDP